MQGRVSEREERETELLCEKIEPIPEGVSEIKPSKTKIKTGLYIKVKNIETNEFEEVKKILSNYKGDTPVFVVCTDSNKKLEAPKSLWIKENNKLLDEISVIIGEENVKLVK